MMLRIRKPAAALQGEPPPRTALLPTLCWCLLATVVSCGKGGPADGTREQFIPIGDGFGYETRLRGTFDNRSLSASIVYRSNEVSVAVWPFLVITFDESAQVTNQLAFFVGGMVEKYPDGNEHLARRLMGFEAPAGPPVDLTDQILRRWAAETGLDVTNVITNSFQGLILRSNAVRVEFGFSRKPYRLGNGEEAILDLPWGDIKAMIEDSMVHGTWHTEKRSGVTYRRKD